MSTTTEVKVIEGLMQNSDAEKATAIEPRSASAYVLHNCKPSPGFLEVPCALIIGDTAIPRSEAQKLRDRIKVLEDALRPFADGFTQVRSGFTEGWIDRKGDEHPLFGINGFDMKLGMIKKAHEALNPTT